MRIKNVMLMALVGCISVFGGCSYITDFVVVNQSDQSVEVQYRIKSHPGTFAAPVAPATIASSRLNTKSSQEWSELTADAIRLDPENRSVTVELMPHQALRIARMHNYRGNEDGANASDFPVEKLMVTGAEGELELVGDQVLGMFSEVSRTLYSITYR